MALPKRVLSYSLAALFIPGAFVLGALWYYRTPLRAALALFLTRIGLDVGLVDVDDDDEAETITPSNGPSNNPDAPALAAQLGAALPATWQPWLEHIAEGVLGNVPDTGSLEPYQFALLVAALLQRESGGAAGSDAAPTDALKNGVAGDSGSRWRAGPPAWTQMFPASLTGKTKLDTRGRTLYEVTAPGAYGGVAGYWGYGPGQLDFESYYSSADFQTAAVEPGWNINETANHLANAIDSLNSIHDGTAAYNCGVAGARTARASGADPDTRTTGGNYAADVIARANAWGAQLPV